MVDATSSPKNRLGRLVRTSCFSFGMVGFGASLLAPPPPRVDFARDVEPIFKAHCDSCHSTASKSGRLSLDTRKGIEKGGASGPLFVPGSSSRSLLIDRVLGKNGAMRMPMGFAPLKPAEIEVLRQWIDQGGKMSGTVKVHWAYVAPTKPSIPTLPNAGWVRNPIDAFTLAKMRTNGFQPSPEADKTTLIRRLSLDLIGLPPTPSEIESFLNDRSPNAYERVVDRLLASPHYGERMALPWLDAARYSDSNGFQQDGDNYQYVWRDWVVRAMNQNMRFDTFTLAQLAGDKLEGATRASADGLDKLVATGFVRNNMLNNEGGAIPEEQRFVELFDRVDTCATTFLGLTMACARCHDHKYDPLTQKDYYSLLAYFNSVPETGIPSDTIGGYYIAQPWVYAGDKAQMKRLHELEPLVVNTKEAYERAIADPKVRQQQLDWERSSSPQPSLPKEVLSSLKVPFEKRSDEDRKRLRSYFLDHVLTGAPKELAERLHQLTKELEDLKRDLPKVMVMSDRQPRKTHILARGNYEIPLGEVHPATPDALPKTSVPQPSDRLGLAKWIVSPENPLTARVQVNRFWQMLFGRGLVKTAENFGVQSEPPVQGPLLDWLAVDFRENGWNVKRLIRMIVTSATYRQSSKVTKALLAKDPENRYLARGARFRLPSMLIRDSALAASGLLNTQMGGKPVYPYQPKGIWDGLAITDERDFTYPQSKGSDLYRRSLYTFWRRTIGPGNMFDSPSRQVCTVRVSRTSTPLHALTTLNDVTWVEAARVLGEKVIARQKSPDERLSLAFRLVCARTPKPAELKVLKRALDRSYSAFRADPAAAESLVKQGDHPRDPAIPTLDDASYANVCLAILNLDEALTRE